MSRENVFAYIDAHLPEHVRRIQALVQQPSVSLEKQGLYECARLVRQQLQQIGCPETALVDVGDDYPGVWARLDSGASKTILYYQHYDVRPVGQEPWDHPPFSGQLVEMDPYPQVMVGRGTRASKGPLQSWLNALEAIQATEGRLPVNVLFLIEGAEIMGSCNYLRLVEQYQEELTEADALLAPGAAQNARGEVSVVLGYKGLIYIELEVNGEDWGHGPAGGPVHSATNAVVDNPAWRLVQALATLTDREGARLVVPGISHLFDERKPIGPAERALLDRLKTRFGDGDPNAFLPGLSTETPVSTFKGGLTGTALLDEYLYAPSANISGLRSGYTGPGSKSFLLPHQAFATLDIRTITDMEAQDLLHKLREHLDREGFADVRIHVYAAYNWGQTDPKSDVVVATLNTLRDYGYRAVVWPMVAFGGPWAHVPRTLGIPALRGAAIGFGDRAATSNEFLVIEGGGHVPGLAEVERYYVDLLYNYADL